MKTFISNFGWDTQPVYRCMLNYGIDSNDEVKLLHTNPDEPRAESAVRELEEMLGQLHQGINIDVVEVDPMDFTTTTQKISNLLQDAEGEVIVNIGSGDRAVLVAMATATTTTNKQIHGVTLFSDTTRQQLEPDFPTFNIELNQTEKQILNEVIRNGDMTNTDIENTTGLAKSTISETINKLNEKGYLDTQRKGKTNKVKPRLAGILATQNTKKQEN